VAWVISWTLLRSIHDWPLVQWRECLALDAMARCATLVDRLCVLGTSPPQRPVASMMAIGDALMVVIYALSRRPLNSLQPAANAPQAGSRQQPEVSMKMSHPSAPSELEKQSTEATASPPLKILGIATCARLRHRGCIRCHWRFRELGAAHRMVGRCRDCRAVIRRAGLAMAAFAGLVLEAIPGVGVIPFWLLVVGAIAVFGTPRPKIGQR
jgi:hypothetical protein